MPVSGFRKAFGFEQLGKYTVDAARIEAFCRYTRAAVIDADGYGFKIPAPVFGFVVLNNDAVAGECVALIHDKVAEAVKDNAVAVQFDRLNIMRMRANDHVGARINDTVRNILLLVIQYGGIFIAAVQINNREVVCLCGSGDIAIEHEMVCCQHSAVRGFGAVNRGDGDETDLFAVFGRYDCVRRNIGLRVIRSCTCMGQTDAVEKRTGIVVPCLAVVETVVV